MARVPTSPDSPNSIATDLWRRRKWAYIRNAEPPPLPPTSAASSPPDVGSAHHVKTAPTPSEGAAPLGGHLPVRPLTAADRGPARPPLSSDSPPALPPTAYGPPSWVRPPPPFVHLHPGLQPLSPLQQQHSEHPPFRPSSLIPPPSLPPPPPPPLPLPPPPLSLLSVPSARSSARPPVPVFCRECAELKEQLKETSEELRGAKRRREEVEAELLGWKAKVRRLLDEELPKAEQRLVGVIAEGMTDVKKQCNAVLSEARQPRDEVSDDQVSNGPKEAPTASDNADDRPLKRPRTSDDEKK